jgi:hypothetical protein
MISGKAPPQNEFSQPMNNNKGINALVCGMQHEARSNSVRSCFNEEGGAVGGGGEGLVDDMVDGPQPMTLVLLSPLSFPPAPAADAMVDGPWPTTLPLSPLSSPPSPAAVANKCLPSPSFPIVLGRTKAQNKQDDTRVNPAKLKNTLEMDILCNTKAVAKFPAAFPLIKLDQNRPDQRPRFEGVVLAVNKLPWLTHNNPAPPPNTADVANCNQSNVDDGPNEHATRKGA